MKRSIGKLYSKTTATMKHSFIREILKITKGVPGMISFAGGLPSPESFPKDLLSSPGLSIYTVPAGMPCWMR